MEISILSTLAFDRGRPGTGPGKALAPTPALGRRPRSILGASGVLVTVLRGLSEATSVTQPWADPSLLLLLRLGQEALT